MKPLKEAMPENLLLRRVTGNKGLGLIAASPFRVGDEVLRDEPLAVFPPTACWFGEDDEAIVERLAPDERKRVMGLADSFHSPPTVAGIIRTNSIPLTLGSEDKDASSRGLFPLACRLNHACAGASNSRFVWRDDLQCLLVMAMREISQGEEVTVTYKKGYAPLEQRQADLRRDFNFCCACAVCTREPGRRASDDFRLTRVQTLLHKVPDVGYESPGSALSMCEQALTLLRLVGIDTPLDLGAVHYMAYQMAKAVGDRTRAARHMEQTWECAVLAWGSSAPLVASYAAKMQACNVLYIGNMTGRLIDSDDISQKFACSMHACRAAQQGLCASDAGTGEGRVGGGRNTL